MGLIDKLFGGKKNDGVESTSPAPQPPVPSGPIPARRERTRPGDLPPAKEAGAAGDAEAGEPTLPQLPMDGENAAVLAAIQAVVAGDTVATRTALYGELLKSQLLLVAMGNEELGEGEIQLQQGQQLQLATIRDPQGNLFLPAFTDIERLAVTLPGEGARYVKLPAQSVFGMFLQGGGLGIVINPGTAPNGLITRAEAEILATGNLPEFDEGGRIKATAQQQMKIAIGKPPTPPPASFVDAIRAAAATVPAIREIHLFHAGIEEQPPRLMIGVLLDEGLTPEQMHPHFEAIGKAAYDARGDAEAFDMMPLHDAMIEAIRPIEGKIYERG